MTELETKLAEALRETFKILVDDIQGITTEEFDGCDWCDGMDSHEEDCEGMVRLATVDKAGDLLESYDAAKAKLFAYVCACCRAERPVSVIDPDEGQPGRELFCMQCAQHAFKVTSGAGL